MKLVNCGEPIPGDLKPNRRYAEIAAGCRAAGMDIDDTDYDEIDVLLERNLLKTTTLQSLDWANPIEALLEGYLPYEAHNDAPLLN